MGSNTDAYGKDAMTAFVGLVILAGTIAGFYALLKKDGEDQKNNLERKAEKENMKGVHDTNPSNRPLNMGFGKQPAMTSLDSLGARMVGHKGEDVPTNITARETRSDAGEFYPRVNLHPSSVNIEAPSSVVNDPAKFGNLVKNVEDLTQGEGVVRRIGVDGREVPREFVKYGMFENHEFYPRVNEFPIRENPHLFDPTHKPPKSHFGPMTYPLVGPIGALGMDYMRAGSDDTRVNIAGTGGRH